VCRLSWGCHEKKEVFWFRLGVSGYGEFDITIPTTTIAKALVWGGGVVVSGFSIQKIGFI
jgi:hypothetical protein